MAIKALAFTTADTVPFVSRTDPDAVLGQKPANPKEPDGDQRDVVLSWNEGASIFKLKPIDVFLMGHIYDRASMLTGAEGSKNIDIHTRMNETNIEAVRHGLAGLPDNFGV